MEKTKSKQTNISIILPVYNAGDFTIKCINSILESKTSVNYEIIIIDDCSKERGLYERLLEFKSQNVKIYQNSKNLGFVKTCNNAIKLSKIDNDIVLLNSDTEVTDYWLDKLYNKAYSSVFIGTVTPFSNNGSICSIPEFCKNNNIPEGYDKNTLNSLIESLNTEQTYILPTCVGFCTYIKRNVLNIVGMLDDKKYGKGYGEENDFSMRVINSGFKNVLDSSTFIYHKGNASFLTGDSFSNENYKILVNDYPNYPKLVQEFISNSPIKKTISLVNILLNNKVFHSKYKRILNIFHYESAIGGVGLFVNKITTKLNNQISFINIKLRPDGVNLQYYGDNNVIEEIFIENNNFSDIYLFHEMIIKQVIELFKINLVHFHHLLGSSSKLLALPASLKLSSIMTLHDLYLINESTDFLFKPENYYNSIKGSVGIEMMLNKVDYLIYPSKFLKDYFNSSFKLTASQQVIDNGTNLEKVVRDFTSKKVLNITFLGSTVKTKGIDIFLKLISENKDTGKFKFHVLGYKSPDLDKYTKEYNLVEGIDYFHKEYVNSDVSAILKQTETDLVIFPSSVSESYSYTLSECIMNSIPVIGRNVGAIGCRIEEGRIGWTYNTYGELKAILEKIYSDQNLLNEKIKTVNLVNIVNLNVTVDEYSVLYNKLCKSLKDSIIDKSSLKLILTKNNTNASIEYNPIANNLLKMVNSNVWLIKRLMLNLLNKKRF